MLLTKEVAIEFLRNSWKMKDVELQIQKDREMFLNKLIKLIHERVPFHLLLLSKLKPIPPAERLVPSMDEINDMCMSGLGGNCIVNNVFTLNLLKALGYSAYLCRSTVTSKDFYVHVLVIVKDLVNIGDYHLVDCGFGQPTFQAISLNFHKESPIYRDSCLEYKFIKHDGKILRMHGDGDLMLHNDPPKEGIDFIIGKWRRYCEFTIETMECRTLDDLGPFYAFRYIPKVNPRANRWPHGKAVMITNGNTLVIEQDDKTLKKTTLQTNEEILRAYKEYFPGINEKLVQEVYSMWHESKL